MRLLQDSARSLWSKSSSINGDGIFPSSTEPDGKARDKEPATMSLVLSTRELGEGKIPSPSTFPPDYFAHPKSIFLNSLG
jgi:hypothetical protein